MIWTSGLPRFIELHVQFPWLMGLIFALSMTVPMAAWMLYREMGWPHTRDMSIASLIGAMLPIAAGWLGIIPMGSAFLLQCPVSCIAMLFPMVIEQVNLAKERATFHSNPTGIESPALSATAVTPPTTNHLTIVTPAVQSTELSFGVTGMTCTSCAATIERILRKIPGVHTA